MQEDDQVERDTVHVGAVFGDLRMEILEDGVYISYKEVSVCGKA